MDHRLKSKKDIEHIFNKGDTLFYYPIKLVWGPSIHSNSTYIKTGVSVSKRNFKKAVDRNRLKRQMREVIRSEMNDPTFDHHLPLSMMYLYIGKEMVQYKLIKSSIHRLISKVKKLHNSNDLIW
ncbi:MAG: ribonuclease P protein component [Saprospiraceae bacterium]